LPLTFSSNLFHIREVFSLISQKKGAQIWGRPFALRYISVRRC
jgi:hypothetical protein